MYAVITRWTLPQARLLEQYRDVRANVMPPVERLPGLVVAYVTVVPSGGVSYEFTVFESESTARAFMRWVGQDRPGQVEYGVERSEVTLVEVVEVAGTA
jgi:hypothetical protein